MVDAIPAKPEVARKLWRGDTRTWTHEFKKADGTAYDLTGHTFIAQYRKDRNRGDIIATATCEVIGAGLVREFLSDVEADKLPGQTDPTKPTIVYWDLQSTNTDGDVRTWLYDSPKVYGDSSDV